MRLLTLILLLAVLLLPAPALAQGPTSLDSLHVALWPEFDDPRLLVILDGVLSQSGGTVRVPIPANAELNAVASADANGSFLNAAYETETDANGQVVVLTPANSAFRVEYYAPLTTNGDQRLAQFALPAGYLTATTASVEVLVPPGATAVTSDPSLQAAGAGTSGGQLFQGQLEGAGDEGFSQEVSYSNPAGALTVSESARVTPAPVATPAPAPSQPARSTTRTPLLLGLGLAAILLIAAGAFGIWRTRQPTSPPASTPTGSGVRPTKPRSASSQPPAPPASGQDRFCRQCGAEFQRNDRFCRQCGATRS